MIITPDTTPRQLFENEVISRRTYNVLMKMNIDTVDKLRSLPLEVFARARNCGARTLLEVDLIRKLPAMQPGEMSRGATVARHIYVDEKETAGLFFGILRNAMLKGSAPVDPDIAAAFAEVFGSGFSEQTDAKELLALTRPGDKPIEHGGTLRRLLVDAVAYAAGDSELHEEYRKVFAHLSDALTAWAPLFDQLDRLDHMEPMFRGNLELTYTERFRAMTVRARNCFRHMSTLHDAVRAIYSPSAIDFQGIKNCGEVSLREFTQMLSAFAEHYKEQIAAQESAPGRVDYSRQYATRRIQKAYPFLTDEQAEHVGGLTVSNGKLPAALVLYHQMMNGADTPSRINRLYYGLESIDRGRTTAETAALTGLTRERVRQVVVSRMPVSEELRAHLEEDSFAPFTEDVVTIGHPALQQLIDAEQLPLEPVQVMGLLCASTPRYTLVRSVVSDHVFACSDRLMEQVRVRAIITAAATHATHRYMDDTHVAYHELCGLEQPYSVEARRALAVLFGHLFSDNHGIVPDEEGLTFRATRLNKSEAIAGLLEERGEAMSFDELYASYRERYPDHAITTRASFRSYILRSDRIRPKGRTGQYVLSGWGDHFTGTITDYLYYVLEMFDGPVSLDELTEYAVRQFPNTNSKSLATLMFIDAERFVKFSGERYGVSSKSYSEPSWVPRDMPTRQTPAARFADYEAFVLHNHRFPYLSSDDEEASLSRWATSLSRGIIDDPDNVVEKVDELRRRFPHYPQNGKEARFWDSCLRMVKIYDQTGAIPSMAEHPALYTWYRKYYRVRHTLTGNVQIYFTQLLRHIGE